MPTLHVELGDRRYPIHIGPGLLNQSDLLRAHRSGRQALVVTNTTVAPLYLDRVRAALTGLRHEALILPDGESYKTLDTLNQVFTALLNHRFDRHCTIIALGGGVIGDLAGFAAACYQRGVNFIQIPTTLLAQVDSSVGGKTAVNHPLGKNMIGAFYQPLCVIADTDTLNTLPDRELSAGLAEVIKYGLIRDLPFLDWLDRHLDALLSRDPAALSQAIERSCRNKADIVAADERETGERALLNLGHTFGHAIETGMGYGVWLHGEAVATGMVMAAELSARLGWLNSAQVERVSRLLAGLRWATTGDTLCSPGHPLWLERIETREPVLGLAIEPQSSADEDQLLEALDQLQQEDPTLRVEEDPETGQRVLRGMGELHLQIAGERLKREFGVNLRVGQPDVVTRETLGQTAESQYQFHRVIEQPDGKKLELKAGARVRVEPLARGAGVTIEAAPRVHPDGVELHHPQREAAADGVKDALTSGPATGAPVQDVAVRVLEIELFGALSSPSALRIAVTEATRKALLQAGGLVMRPIMATEVVVPEGEVGSVLGDLQSRHAVIRDTTTLDGMTIIHCDCALDRLLGYITDLRGMTRGRGQFTMTFDRFDVV